MRQKLHALIVLKLLQNSLNFLLLKKAIYEDSEQNIIKVMETKIIFFFSNAFS
jgi:hypothetical protein